MANDKINDKIKVLCSRCKASFRERVAKLRDGYQAQCPNCYRLIQFDTGSDDAYVRRAMTEARRIRNGFVYATEDSQPTEGR